MTLAGDQGGQDHRSGGFTTAFGIVHDTFVVRLPMAPADLLVPAIVKMFGDRALWPTARRSVG